MHQQADIGPQSRDIPSPASEDNLSLFAMCIGENNYGTTLTDENLAVVEVCPVIYMNPFRSQQNSCEDIIPY